MLPEKLCLLSILHLTGGHIITGAYSAQGPHQSEGSLGCVDKGKILTSSGLHDTISTLGMMDKSDACPVDKYSMESLHELNKNAF